MPTLTQLQEWTKANVLDVAEKIFADAPMTRSIECDKCEGTGRDPDFLDLDDEYDNCIHCQGEGVIEIELSEKRRRRWIDKRLREAGLNPAAFDDHGRLIRTDSI
jgi:hypothetical protein